jgi:hypothetical protein
VGRKSELGSRGGGLGRWEKEKEREEESGPRERKKRRGGPREAGLKQERVRSFGGLGFYCFFSFCFFLFQHTTTKNKNNQNKCNTLTYLFNLI